MSDFLSDAWVAQLDATYAESPGSSPEPVTVQYVVATDAGDRRYHLIMGPDRDHAVVGDAEAPHVTFSMNEETARAISAGDLSTEEAFITGRLDIDGDPGPLIEAYQAARDDA